MKRSTLYLGFPLIVVLTVSSGLLQGRMANRWGRPQAMLDAGAKLEGVPTQIGDWKSQSSTPLDPNAREILECAGHIHRVYANQRGQGVEVTVLVGPSGPTSVHTPEVCYSSQNFTKLADRKRFSVSDSAGAQHELWSVDFRSNSLRGGRHRVYYGWTADGRWSAPADPRFSFASSPHLYKIQLAVNLPWRPAANADEAASKFLADFLPALHAYLVPALGRVSNSPPKPASNP